MDRDNRFRLRASTAQEARPVLRFANGALRVRIMETMSDFMKKNDAFGLCLADGRTILKDGSLYAWLFDASADPVLLMGRGVWRNKNMHEITETTSGDMLELSEKAKRVCSFALAFPSLDLKVRKSFVEKMTQEVGIDLRHMRPRPGAEDTFAFGRAWPLRSVSRIVDDIMKENDSLSASLVDPVIEGPGGTSFKWWFVRGILRSVARSH